MCNAFAWRETNRLLMLKEASPEGSCNDDAIKFFAGQCGMTIAAWGNDGAHRNRSVWLKLALQGLLVHHLGMTQKKEPKHPLYLRSDTKPILWEGM